MEKKDAFSIKTRKLGKFIEGKFTIHADQYCDRIHGGILFANTSNFITSPNINVTGHK